MNSGRAAILIGGKRIEGWSDYEVSLDLLEPADSFALGFPGADEALYNLCARDAPLEVFIDEVRVLSGFIGRRNLSVVRPGGPMLEIGGRDKVGRLVDEGMELITFNNLTLETLAKKVAAPWFSAVSFSNATNRALLRGSSARPVAVAREPALDQAVKPKRKVHPGETRWQILQHYLELADYLATSAADGKTLILLKPNYDQESAYTFFLPAPGSERAHYGNVLEVKVMDDIEDCYSEVTVISSVHDEDEGGKVIRARGVAVDGPGPRGAGGLFRDRKVAIIKDDTIRSNEEAKKRAAREIALRKSTGFGLELVVPYHVHPADELHLPALYAPDNMATFTAEAFPALSGKYLVTATSFTNNRSEGPKTRLKLVPKGALLRM